MAGCWRRSRNCVLTRVWQPFRIWSICVFMLKGTRFIPRTLRYTVKTNVLKKRVEVLIRKIILPLTSLSSKLVTYTLIPVAIYLFRRTVSSTQGIDIVLFFQYYLRCCNVSTCWKSVSIWVFLLTLPRKHLLTHTKGLHWRNHACI